MSQFPNRTYRTGQNAVAANSSQDGWVSGDPASLAASGTVTALFDLGPNWDNVGLIQVGVTPVAPSSGVTVTVKSSSDTTIDATDQILNHANGAAIGGAAAVSVTAAAPGSGWFRPMARFLAVVVVNADGVNALGATSFIAVTTYSNLP